MVLRPRNVAFPPTAFSNRTFENVDSLCLFRQSQYISRPFTWKSSMGVRMAISSFTAAGVSGSPRNATFSACAARILASLNGL